MAPLLDTGIVTAALAAAALYTGRVLWRIRKGGSVCSGCPSGGKPQPALVQLRRPRR